MKKRALMGLLLLSALTACQRPITVLRLGYSPDLTNGVALVGVESGRFATAGDATIRATVFGAGPLAVDPLLSRDLDAAYLDPISAMSAFLRSNGRYVIVSGAATGGAALVKAKKSKAVVATDLGDSKVATPAMGNVQDVAARVYFGALGFVSYEQGGGFRMSPIANPDLLATMTSGETDAAWTVEPWVSLLVEQGGGRVLLDEGSLWTVGGSTVPYPTSVLLVRKSLLRSSPQVMSEFLRHHVDTVEWMNAHPAEAQALAETALTKVTGVSFPPGLMARAWARVHFTTEVPRETLAQEADNAARVGYFGLKPFSMAKLLEKIS